MIGALSLDMEQARKNLDAAAERQRAFIRASLMNRGIERYDNARVQNAMLIVTVPEDVENAPAAAPAMVRSRVNGPATVEVTSKKE